jgi:pimeloyl-ACP methyl ester carboxylesterase
VTLPECGHGMMAEAPDLVLDALREFIASPV